MLVRTLAIEWQRTLPNTRLQLITLASRHRYQSHLSLKIQLPRAGRLEVKSPPWAVAELLTLIPKLTPNTLGRRIGAITNRW